MSGHSSRRVRRRAGSGWALAGNADGRGVETQPGTIARAHENSSGRPFSGHAAGSSRPDDRRDGASGHRTRPAQHRVRVLGRLGVPHHDGGVRADPRKARDLYGRRATFLSAVSLFVVASALAGLADSIGVLIAMRALQGLAGGGLMNLATAAIADLVPAAERAASRGTRAAYSPRAVSAGLCWAECSPST
ncbi:MFS transporter [Streptomyces tuirus]|uniref:MFS transporter n=1 Tax=Streptomyces tuirus TaxID=68278 RepID=A0A941FJV9_9ACTN|nr:MFS transporter [Streptomyces tuirus]